MNRDDWNCPQCGSRLETAARWARLVTREPELVRVHVPEGPVSVLHVGGDPVIQVRCSNCGSAVLAGRDVPLAAA